MDPFDGENSNTLGGLIYLTRLALQVQIRKFRVYGKLVLVTASARLWYLGGHVFGRFAAAAHLARSAGERTSACRVRYARQEK